MESIPPSLFGAPACVRLVLGAFIHGRVVGKDPEYQIGWYQSIRSSGIMHSLNGKANGEIKFYSLGIKAELSKHSLEPSVVTLTKTQRVATFYDRFLQLYGVLAGVASPQGRDEDAATIHAMGLFW